VPAPARPPTEPDYAWTVRGADLVLVASNGIGLNVVVDVFL